MYQEMDTSEAVWAAGRQDQSDALRKVLSSLTETTSLCYNPGFASLIFHNRNNICALSSHIQGLLKEKSAHTIFQAIHKENSFY